MAGADGESSSGAGEGAETSGAGVDGTPIIGPEESGVDPDSDPFFEKGAYPQLLQVHPSSGCLTICPSLHLGQVTVGPDADKARWLFA